VRPNRQTIVFAVLYVLGSGASAEPADESDPLFESNELVEVRLSAPFTSIMKNRDSEEDVRGIAQYVDKSGNQIEFDVGIQPRGRFRRNKEICTFAPLRLNFKKRATKDTELAGQNKLKLVTHCRKYPKRYQQTVVAEYMAYRILNLLTDVSFRVRLMRITYVDTDDDSDEYESFAILIEDDDRLAARIGVPDVNVELAVISELRPDFTNLTSVFHYFIGNTDFSPKSSSPNTRCCHNHRLFANEGELYYSVPYDFDQAGIVDAPHAAPNPRFELDSVKDRLYRGRCEFKEQLPATLELFRERREEIESLVQEQAEMTDRSRKVMLRYIEKFYDTIDNPKSVEREFVKKCT